MATITAKEFLKGGKPQLVAGATPQPVKEDFSRVQETFGDIKETGSAIAGAFTRGADKFAEIETAQATGEQGMLRSKFQKLGTGAGGVASAIGEGIMGAGKALLSQSQEEGIAGAVEPVKTAIGESTPVQSVLARYKKLQEENPALARDIEATLGLASLAGSVATGGAVGTGVKATKTLLTSGVKTAARKTADASVEQASGLKQSVQSYLARKNVSPQLESSATRLTDTALQQKSATIPQKPNIPQKRFLAGTARIEDPAQSYEQFLTQSKKALTDIKVDPAVSVVGERIGDAFQQVSQTRRAVGQTMGDELKKVGGMKADITDAYTGLETALKEADLVYSDGKLVAGKTAKMTDEDMSLLNSYIKELNTLGSTPTIAQIDAVISRTQGLVNNFKSAKGITETTNAERLIKGSQAKLREQFDPKKTGNPALTDYAEARRLYAELSNFLDEGAGFLGKYTQSGDFAKDASLAKSSVQSVLNQGKKDWLIKLEALTGYPAIDEAVLALQAMKDAGDFRGLSLLESFADVGIPTSKAGFTQKVIDYAVGKGTKAVVGSPEEQTRLILKELQEEARKKANQGFLKEKISKMIQDDNKILETYAFAKKETPELKAAIESISETYGFQLPKDFKNRKEFIMTIIQSQFEKAIK